MDFDSDGVLDVVLGYPGDKSDDSEPLPCDDVFDVTCFGLYDYSGPFPRSVKYTAASAVPKHPVTDWNAETSLAKVVIDRVYIYI